MRPAVDRRLEFRGDNWKAFASKRDLLLCGPAGTGKTITHLAKLFHVCDNYPGTRALLCRKTRGSLTETGLVTWERDILGLDHKMLTSRPIQRSVRQDYRFPRKRGKVSELIVCGLDKPDKALSSDYDIIYMLESTDFMKEEYEQLSSRLRSGAMPWQQMILDCNPTRPTHWLFKKSGESRETGGIARFNSRHIDNPRFFDPKLPGRTNLGTDEKPVWVAGQWTDEGNRYVNKRLKNLTGARRKRFYEGIWAAAEGLVFDGYNPAVHDLASGWRPPDHWRRFWSIDWGFNVPTVVQMWAVDDDGVIYLYREIYRTGVRVETLAKECGHMVRENEELMPMAIVADHDPEAHETWRVHSGLPIENAWKEDKYESIEHAQSRFDLDDAGKPKIRIRPDCRQHAPDPVLVDAGRPSCTLEEFAGYIWAPPKNDKIKDEVVKENDHGCDAFRYAAGYARRFMSDTGGFKLSTGTSSSQVHGDIRVASW